MAFTGEAVRQGNADRFGAGSPGATPRAFVSFDGEPYVITRDALVHITDLANGSGVLIQNNADYDLSDPDPTCGFAYNSRLYFLNRDGFTLQRFNDPLTGDVSLVDFFSNIDIPSAAATDGTTVWIYDANFDALHTIDPDTATTTLLGTVEFDVTTPANNIGGMFYRDGSLFLLDNGTELMFELDIDALQATAVDVSVIEFGASQRGVNGGSVHLGEAYMAGGNPDALYRFYNVRWDETIPTVEVDGGGNGSLDLTTVSTDATSFEFAPGYTAPSWLTISGDDLVITSAPDVSVDTDYSPELRAVRSGFNEEKTLTVRVNVAAPTIPLTFGAGTIADQAWEVGTAESLILPEATGGTGTIAYSLSTPPTGVTFTPGTQVLAGTPTGRFTSATFTYTATAGTESVELTFTIVVTAPAITFSPASFANQTWTVGTAVSLTLPVGSGGVGDLTPTLIPTLPSGITFTASTRTLAGNPNTTFASATFTYRLTDDEGVSATITFTIVVAAAPVALGFGTSVIAVQAWDVGTAVSLTLPQATGGHATKTYSLSPGTPAGITFTPSTRRLTGTPTGRFASATFTYTVTDGDNDTASLTFTIVVTAAFSFDSTIDDQIWTVDETESLTLPGATGGVGALMYALAGMLPTGMTRSNFDVSGTPTEESIFMSFTWTVTDGESVAIQQTFTIVVNVSTVEADRLEAQRIRQQASILPPNATILQVDILHTAIEMLNVHTHETFNGQEEIPIKYLWNPDLCPENALPNLARALSIEIDITQFGVDTQRELIKNSFTIHRQKGTIASIRSALETFNITLASDWLVEGRRDINNDIIREDGGWAHFSINIESSIPTSLAQEITGFLENIAPARSKLVSFTFPAGLAYLQWET